MAVFQKPVLELAPFGRIEYFSAYWRGSLRLSAFENEFDLIVRARRDGPSAAQIAALAHLAANAAAIKETAAEPMIDVHRQSGLLADDLVDAPRRIWDLLEPEQIEVADESYYGDGRIAILMIFGSRLDEDFAPAIETADGTFADALSGT